MLFKKRSIQDKFQKLRYCRHLLNTDTKSLTLTFHGVFSEHSVRINHKYIFKRQLMLVKAEDVLEKGFQL